MITNETVNRAIDYILRHISLCGCVHNFIWAVSFFDRPYNCLIQKEHKFRSLYFNLLL